MRALRQQERSDISWAIDSGGHMCSCDPFTTVIAPDKEQWLLGLPAFLFLFHASSQCRLLCHNRSFSTAPPQKDTERALHRCANYTPPPPISMDSDSQESIRPEKYIQLNREGIWDGVAYGTRLALSVRDDYIYLVQWELGVSKNNGTTICRMQTQNISASK